MASIACFVSAHGFGHATRTAAILESLRGLLPTLDITIVSAVPARVFADTVSGFTHHSLEIDVGLVQRTALDIDYPATLERLSALLPYSPKATNRLAEICQQSSLILCDISPWGVLVGEELGVPSVLVENFTWDFIYTPATRRFPQLTQYAGYLRSVFDRASYHIQTEPLCFARPCDLTCGPIFRRQRVDRRTTRQRLPGGFRKTVLVTLGGIAQGVPSHPFHHYPDLLFIFAGQTHTVRLADNLLVLGTSDNFYHPDLLAAVDLVVCKSGYSTLAECCQAGTRAMVIGREDFPESPILLSYAKAHLGATAIAPPSISPANGWSCLRRHWRHPRSRLLPQTVPITLPPSCTPCSKTAIPVQG